MRIHTDQSPELAKLLATANTDALRDYAAELERVVDEADWQAPECSVCLPGAEQLATESRELVNSLVGTGVQYVFLVGIGGSNLGTVAIHNALRNRFARTEAPELINLDTVSAVDIATLQKRFGDGLDPASYIVFIISKSGGTAETIANAEFLYQAVLTDPAAKTERTVVITDADSALDQFAATEQMARLHIPQQVGGRYSVFSPVGIAPLLALGYDTAALLQGARDILPYCVRQDVSDNPALAAAAATAAAISSGYRVYDLFVFDPALESLGKWNRQLLGESVGKRENSSGEVVETGIVPTVSVGSTDLHSVGQLYLGGVPTVLTMFVSVAKTAENYAIATTDSERQLPTLVSDITDRSSNDINQAILSGTKDAYNNVARPFCEAELADISAYELGAFMQYKMLETMYLARALSVNAFNQPNVELYKTFTKAYLRNQTN